MLTVELLIVSDGMFVDHMVQHLLLNGGLVIASLQGHAGIYVLKYVLIIKKSLHSIN